MSTKKKILLIFGYIRTIEKKLFSIVPLPVTSLCHQYYTKVSHRNISKESILDLYAFAKQLNDDNLTRTIWRWLKRKPKRITDPLIKIIFENQDINGLTKLLKKDYININEERIFQHSINWLKKQYSIRSKLSLKSTSITTNIEETPRDIIQPILELIRFPLMSLKYLSSEVYNSGILTDKEFLAILRAKHTKDQTLTVFNMKKRKRKRYRDSVDHDEDEGFDTLNMNENIVDNDNYEDITDKIQGILNSGEYSGYPMAYMYADGDNYWCSCDISDGSNVWIIFDCKMYDIGKIEIKFNGSYACSIVKVYSAGSKRTFDWDKITKKVGMIQDGTVKTILVRSYYARFIKLKFEDWTNGYVGVQRIKFYQRI